MFAVGLSLLLYPSVADWWNQLGNNHDIDQYTQQISAISNEEYRELLHDAEVYNKKIAGIELEPGEEVKEYEDILNFNDKGMMGVLKIPSIRVNLPIYHGTSDEVLHSSIGHIEDTSLPVGGSNTHSVLSGHRGLPSAKLLTDLDRLETGDYFMITILDDMYTYQVDQILIVEPEDLSSLLIEDGKDYVTLVTCTPYGINTHRLLVRGHRIDNLPDDYIEMRNEAIIVDRNKVAVFVAAGLMVLIIASSSVSSALRRKRSLRHKRGYKN